MSTSRPHHAAAFFFFFSFLFVRVACCYWTRRVCVNYYPSTCSRNEWMNERTNVTFGFLQSLPHVFPRPAFSLFRNLLSFLLNFLRTSLSPSLSFSVSSALSGCTCVRVGIAAPPAPLPSFFFKHSSLPPPLRREMCVSGAITSAKRLVFLFLSLVRREARIKVDDKERACDVMPGLSVCVCTRPHAR